METKATDDPFYTPRSSARRGYSSGGSEDERFTSPRTSARSVSSDENDFKTPREGSIASPRDGAIHPTSARAAAASSEDYYKRAMGKPQPRLNLNELKYALPDEYADTADAKKTGRTAGYDQEYKAQAFGRGTQASARDSGRSGVADMRSPRSVEAPAVEENDIFSAARHNRIDSVTYMLDQGLSVNLRDSYGNTILSIACQNGLKRMAKLALRRGTNINSQNNRGNTALHFCFAYGYGDTLGEYLISKGADTTIANQDGLLCFDGIDPRSPRK